MTKENNLEETTRNEAGRMELIKYTMKAIASLPLMSVAAPTVFRKFLNGEKYIPHNQLDLSLHFSYSFGIPESILFSFAIGQENPRLGIAYFCASLVGNAVSGVYEVCRSKKYSTPEERGPLIPY